MPARYLKWLLSALAAIFCSWSIPASACTVTPSPPTAELGTYGSLALIDGIVYTSSSTTGIRCTTLLEVLSNSYIGLKIDGSIPPLKNTLTNETIPLVVSTSYNGPALIANHLYEEVGTTVLGLLKSSGGNITLHYRTTATAPIRAGTYEANFTLRWYYSFCSLGAAVICTPVNSTGLKRSCLLVVCGDITDWGTGEPVTVKIRLVVQRDCVINAPPINFGTKPLVDLFPTLTQTITVRCGFGPGYAVALNDGLHSGGTKNRRMQLSPTNRIGYEIEKGTSGTNRWGSDMTERWSSSAATTLANIHDGSATQTYSYRARILPELSDRPIHGSYKDTIRLDIIF